MNNSAHWALAAAGACIAVSVSAQEPAAAEAAFGHSHHGEAYDTGPRQRPWRMNGIGETHFEVTTSVPEVQEWYDQGNTLLHSFWYYEAERAFRWCIKLDPKCAMAYLGLLRARPFGGGKPQPFLDQAVANKQYCSEREQRIIEAWEKSFLPTIDRPVLPGPMGWMTGNDQLAEELETVIIDYPDDIEIKMLILHQHSIESRLGSEAMLQDVLNVAPDHPGAHHLRIHNWDSIESGHVVLDSCKAYGPIAPEVGHANHMPGHIYTKLGMWHEGAISLDNATRVEKAYMQRQLVFPFNNWNYSHNRNFLAYAQEMLGMPSLAMQGARDLLNAPLDPKHNKNSTELSVFGQGIAALRRVLVRYERWEDILDKEMIPWPTSPAGTVWKHYCTALAMIGTGDVDGAEALFQKFRTRPEPKMPPGMPLEVAASIKDGAKKSQPTPNANEGGMDDDVPPAAQLLLARRTESLRAIMEKEIEARLRQAKGDSLRAIAVMEEAAALEFEQRERDNDPPPYPRCLYVVLGEWLLEYDSPRLAVAAFEKSAEILKNNGFALSGLARAHHALGEHDKAKRAFARMQHVWSGAEGGIWQRDRAMALGIEAKAFDASPAEQRNYRTDLLEPRGPGHWEPYAAPELSAVDATQQRVSLEQFRGKNVLLVFYLSAQCVHCVEQLREIETRASEFAKRDTVLLAISADPSEKNADTDLNKLPFQLLSDDPAHGNAIRWLSYDEFEELELHSTNLVDRHGRLRWAQTGGDPFMDMDFLLDEIDRIESIDEQDRLKPLLGAAPATR